MNMEHWAQGVRRKGRPRMLAMDYGRDCVGGPWQGLCNQKQYHQIEPPEYQLNNVHIPLALLSGTFQQRTASRLCCQPLAIMVYCCSWHCRWLYGMICNILLVHINFASAACVSAYLSSTTNPLCWSVLASTLGAAVALTALWVPQTSMYLIFAWSRMIDDHDEVQYTMAP